MTDRLQNIRLRKATEGDCLDILSWRNHPKVRRKSFRREEISYSEHRKWFTRKLHNRDPRIYIAEVRDLGKIGQIRFDILNSCSARVNVNLNPAFLGKGFGNKVIAKGSHLFLKENPGIKIIIAEILDANFAAKKAFQKANYIFSRNILKNGRKASIYRFIK